MSMETGEFGALHPGQEAVVDGFINGLENGGLNQLIDLHRQDIQKERRQTAIRRVGNFALYGLVGVGTAVAGGFNYYVVFSNPFQHLPH